MTPDKEIQDQIQKEMAVYLRNPYPHRLPEWFLDNFEKAVFSMPQGWCKYTGVILKEILGKKDSGRVVELTIMEVGLIANVYQYSEPKFIAKDVREFANRKILIENIQKEYNTLSEQEYERLYRKTSKAAAVRQQLSRPTIVHP